MEVQDDLEDERLRHLIFTPQAEAQSEKDQVSAVGWDGGLTCCKTWLLRNRDADGNSSVDGMPAKRPIL